MCVLRTKADHQGKKIPSTVFRWTGFFLVEKALLSNLYLVLKIGTDKTKKLHRMRIRHFTSRQPIHYLQTTPQEWKPDPEVITKHDGLDAGE